MPPKPVAGDLKIVYKFAWLPKRIKNKVIWMEYYKQLYEWKWHKHIMIFWTVIDVIGWVLVGEKIDRGTPRMYPLPMPPWYDKNDLLQKEKWEQVNKDMLIDDFKR